LNLKKLIPENNTDNFELLIKGRIKKKSVSKVCWPYPIWILKTVLIRNKFIISNVWNLERLNFLHKRNGVKIAKIIFKMLQTNFALSHPM